MSYFNRLILQRKHLRLREHRTDKGVGSEPLDSRPELGEHCHGGAQVGHEAAWALTLPALPPTE